MSRLFRSTGDILVALSPILFAILVVALARGLVSFANGQEGHPPEHMLLHEKFYSGWQRPDNREYLCCGDKDCYPAPARQRPDGRWEYMSRLLNTWVIVPDDRVELDRETPDGNSHVCTLENPASAGGMTEEGDMPPTQASETVLCFIYGGGT